MIVAFEIRQEVKVRILHNTCTLHNVCTCLLLVISVKSEQVLGLLFTFSGKAHQDVSATAPVGAQGGNRSFPKQAASTEIEQEPTGYATGCKQAGGK